MATRQAFAGTDEAGNYTVRVAGLNETGGVRDVSTMFTLPPVDSMPYTVAASGNFDTSVTVTLQGSLDGGSTWPLTLATALTAAAPVVAGNLIAPHMRFAVTADGAGDASNLTAVLMTGRMGG